MCPRDDAQSEFDYPEDRLFKLGGILTAAQIRQPNNQDLKGDPVRFVIKRGHTTLTTIGRLSGLESHQCRYGLVGTFDSVEAAVYPYDNDSGPFSRGGNSGAQAGGANGEFTVQVTAGTGLADSSDITYGTPMHWLWNDVIKPQFPGLRETFSHRFFPTTAPSSPIPTLLVFCNSLLFLGVLFGLLVQTGALIVERLLSASPNPHVLFVSLTLSSFSPARNLLFGCWCWTDAWTGEPPPWFVSLPYLVLSYL
ncbi:hypothetical protein FRB94_000843 [Tulasnella sp. JGI-2019a]|nr:hypothetical protein FRB94_000843 [Tulasnella sp. JGI-2019a]